MTPLVLDAILESNTRSLQIPVDVYGILRVPQSHRFVLVIDRIRVAASTLRTHVQAPKTQFDFRKNGNQIIDHLGRMV
jgi:hypothetical protein